MQRRRHRSGNGNSRRDAEHDGPAVHGSQWISWTVETLPSPCLNTSFTRPLSGANHLVRVPLPNVKPGWFNVLVTTSA